ncbi:MAG: hypothetical protein RL757_2557 [Bacteroidota bacterium]
MFHQKAIRNAREWLFWGFILGGGIFWVYFYSFLKKKLLLIHSHQKKIYFCNTNYVTIIFF